MFYKCLVSFWDVIPAGAFIAILGFTAALMALYERPDKKWKRAGSIAFLFALMVGEILVLRREQRKGEEHFAQLTFGLQSALSTSASIQRAVGDLGTITIALNKAQLMSTNRASLRVESLLVSRDILLFLSQQEQQLPKLPTDKNPGEISRMLTSQMREAQYRLTLMVADYNRQFRPRVEVLLNKIYAQHIDAKNVKEACSKSESVAEIDSCAVEIGSLAERIP